MPAVDPAATDPAIRDDAAPVASLTAEPGAAAHRGADLAASGPTVRNGAAPVASPATAPPPAAAPAAADLAAPASTSCRVAGPTIPAPTTADVAATAALALTASSPSPANADLQRLQQRQQRLREEETALDDSKNDLPLPPLSPNPKSPIFSCTKNLAPSITEQQKAQELQPEQEQ